MSSLSKRSVPARTRRRAVREERNLDDSDVNQSFVISSLRESAWTERQEEKAYSSNMELYPAKVYANGMGVDYLRLKV